MSIRLDWNDVLGQVALSLRPVFLRASSDFAITYSRSLSLDSFETSGLYQIIQYSCDHSSCHSNLLTPTLQYVQQHLGGLTCTQNGLTASLEIEAWNNGVELWVGSIVAETIGAYTCGAGKYIFSARAESYQGYAWTISDFEDSVAAGRMLKEVDFKTSARLSGIELSGNLPSSSYMGSNLLGISGSSRKISDSPLDTSSAIENLESAFANALATLETGSAECDMALSDLAELFNDELETYVTLRPYPSIVDFLAYFESKHSDSVHFFTSGAQSAMSAWIHVFAKTPVTSFSNPEFEVKFNDALTAIGSQISGAASSLTSATSISGEVFCSFVGQIPFASVLGGDDDSLDFEDPITTVAASLKVTFSGSLALVECFFDGTDIGPFRYQSSSGVWYTLNGAFPTSSSLTSAQASNIGNLPNWFAASLEPWTVTLSEVFPEVDEMVALLKVQLLYFDLE